MTTTLEYDYSFDTPTSSVIQEVHYETENEVLYVTLNDNVYAYFGVPKSVYIDFVFAPSAGGYYAKQIRNGYGPATFVDTADLVDFSFGVDGDDEVLSNPEGEAESADAEYPTLSRYVDRGALMQLALDFVKTNTEAFYTANQAVEIAQTFEDYIYGDQD